MLQILWLAVLVLFVLWLVGLGVGWASSVVWTLFVVGLVVLGIAIIASIFRSTTGMFRRGPTTSI